MSDKISKTLNLTGFNNIEFGLDTAGDYSVIEVNARTSATMFQNKFVDKK